jgi:hypothetical protein
MKTYMRSFALTLLVAATVFGFGQTGTNVLPSGTEIKVRTDTEIPAKPAANARYGATTSNEIRGSNGNLLIPRNSRATLVAIPSNDGKDTTLDLQSVSVNGRRYNLAVDNNGKNGSKPDGLGANARTGKYVGGGAAVGAVLGVLMGGGKGAAIGAVLGGAGGAGAQVLTGKSKAIPAETELSYKLAQDLVMRRSSSN